MSSALPDSVVVSETGMVSAVGRDVDTTCASVRAGIRRTVELDANIFDEDSGELIPVVGNAMTGFTDGFMGPARIARLASGALRDLLERADLRRNELRTTSFHICLPGGYYLLEDMRRSLEDSIERSALKDALRDEEEQYLGQLRHVLERTITEFADANGSAPAVRYYHGDQAVCVRAIQEAQVLLQNRTCDRCIIGGADSLVDESSVRYLDRLQLLKTPIRPFGVIPGEAAAFFLLERSGAAKSRGARRRAAIISQGYERDSTAHRFSGRNSDGRTLTRAALRAWDPLRSTRMHIARLMTPLNGDVWKAHEWGKTLINLPETARATPQWTPAETLGSVGAASGAAAVCLSAGAFQRRYAGEGAVVVCLSSDSGEKGAFVIAN